MMRRAQCMSELESKTSQEAVQTKEQEGASATGGHTRCRDAADN